MKPRLWRIGHRWFCTSPGTFIVGFGATPFKAYTDWVFCGGTPYVYL